MPKKDAVASTAIIRLEIGDQIRRQRESIKLTATDLATKLNVSRNTIANYESGSTEPSASDLLSLAHALGCSTNDLLQRGATSSPPRFAFRAHAPLRKNPSVITSARRYLKAYDEIETITESRLRCNLRGLGGDFKGPLKPREIETAAKTLRHASGILDAGPENIAGVLEGLGVRTLFFETEAHGFEGVSTIQGEMTLVMLRKRKKVVERTIFSAAHELGHLVLHPHLFSDDAKDDEVDSKVYEREADQFAGNFLVPSEDLIRLWNEERLGKLRLFNALMILKEVFRVSFHCLYYRVTDLGLHPKVDRAIFTNLIKQQLGITGTATMEDLEPEPLNPGSLYDTTRFSRLVQSAFLQGLIQESKVAQMLQVPVNKAHEITSEWLKPKYELVDESTL